MLSIAYELSHVGWAYLCVVRVIKKRGDQGGETDKGGLFLIIGLEA